MHTLIFVLLAICLLVQCDSSSQVIMDSLAKKYCQLQDISGGYYCPFGSDANNNRKIADYKSGLGWNSIKRNLVFPVYEKYETVPARKTKEFVYEYSNAREFFARYNTEESIHPVHSDIDWIQTAFSSYQTKVFVTTKNYLFSQSFIKTNNYTIEYSQFIELLPIEFDSNSLEHQYLYSLFFDLFGTHVVHEMQYGGSIYQISTIKECRNTQGESLQELNTRANGDTFTSDYIKYRRASDLIIKGGNPEIMNNITNRIQSFENSQVPVEFKLKNILESIPKSELVKSVEKALVWYLTKTKNLEQELVEKIEKAKYEEFIGPQPVHVFLIYNPGPLQKYRSYIHGPIFMSINQRYDFNDECGSAMIMRNNEGQVYTEYFIANNLIRPFKRHCQAGYTLTMASETCTPDFPNIFDPKKRNTKSTQWLCGPNTITAALNCLPYYTLDNISCACRGFDS